MVYGFIKPEFFLERLTKPVSRLESIKSEQKQPVALALEADT
jgi:hypothetical protein